VTLNTILIISLTLSAGLNALLYWLAKQLFNRLTVVANKSTDLQEMIESFEGHIKAVYELESFYGDETLNGLLTHARGLSEILKREYGDLNSLAEEIEYEEEEDDDGSKEDQQQKHVLYAGTRKSDS